MEHRRGGAALMRGVGLVDGALEQVARAFHLVANLCLGLMLVGTAATILLRPFNVSYYWIWPWTMQVFVWMTFFGFFVVYRRGKDIAVDFLVRKMGDRAMVASRYFVAVTIMVVTGVISAQMPTIFESQVGEIEGVITPTGWELQRYTLSVPLALSTGLIFLNATLELVKTFAGVPEPLPDHRLDPEG